MERTESGGPSAGPPRIGNSTSGWRERQAAKLAGDTAAIPAELPPAAPKEDAPPPTRDAPPAAGRSGYVPPHLRKGMPPTGGESNGAAEGWRSASRGREENDRRPSARLAPPARDTSARTESPASGVGRSFSGRRDAPERTESPAAPLASTGGPGKYKPGAFRSGGRQ